MAGSSYVLRILFLVVVVSLAAACSLGEKSEDGPRSDITEAIERTARYFDNRPLRGDVAFLLSQASRRVSPDFFRWSQALKADPAVNLTMKDPASVQSLEAILWLERERPHRPWQSLPPPLVGPSANPPTLTDEEITAITRVMGMGLNCKQLNAEQGQIWRTLLASPSHSYLLTHLLLSLVWGRDSGCLPEEEAGPLRTTLATAIYGELLADKLTVNDLSLERMAMLCYADLCNWVSDEQTNAVLQKQLADGSWGNGSVPVNPRASVTFEHTAALGFYVLAMKWDSASPPPRPPR